MRRRLCGIDALYVASVGEENWCTALAEGKRAAVAPNSEAHGQFFQTAPIAPRFGLVAVDLSAVYTSDSGGFAVTARFDEPTSIRSELETQFRSAALHREAETAADQGFELLLAQQFGFRTHDVGDQGEDYGRREEYPIIGYCHAQPKTALSRIQSLGKKRAGARLFRR